MTELEELRDWKAGATGALVCSTPCTEDEFLAHRAAYEASPHYREGADLVAAVTFWVAHQAVARALPRRAG